MVLLSLRDIFTPLMLSILPQKHMLSLMLLFLSGIQIVSLGLAAQAISFSKYFDSKNKIVRFLSKHGKLERGILCGGFLIFLSIISFVYLLISYLGYLPSITIPLRFDLAVFAIMFFLWGIQLVYTSFLLSLFYIKVK